MASNQTRPITRIRDRLVCTECRRRKLKCNRATPCSSCVRRGTQSACEYQRSSGSAEDERDRRIHAEQRLEHLEKLVQQLATQQTPAQSQGPASQQTTTTYSFPSTDNFVYNGSTHWSAMLQDIQALRTAMTPADGTGAEMGSPEPETDTIETDPGIHLLFGVAPSHYLTFDEVLSRYLPSRQETDRLTAAYFRHKAIAAPFLHAAQFRRLYQSFWSSPTSAPPLWVSLLFSVCHIAFSTQRQSSTSEPPSSNHFSLASAYCLTLGCYFRPQPFAVEALLLFAQAQCIASLELPADLGPLFGSLMRLATRMGYHRDPDVHGSNRFTPFEAEMRRRTWSLAMQLDLLISFHLGLPSNVQYPTWDTKVPRAVMSAELHEDMTELPPERGEATDILFYIVKHRFMEVFEKILRHVLTIEHRARAFGNGQRQLEHDEVEMLDKEIRDVYATIPEVVRPKEMTDSVFDSPSAIVTRLCVSNLYNKCLFVLHRPYVILERTESVSVCWTSSRDIVRHMIDVCGEFEPGGQMELEAWFMSSLTWHDFLIGATALCLALCKLKTNGMVPEDDVKLLERARSIFANQAPQRAKETLRVIAVIDATTLHLRSHVAISDQRHIPDLLMVAGNGETVAQTTDIGQNWGFQEFSTTAEPLPDPTWEYLEQLLDLGPQ